MADVCINCKKSPPEVDLKRCAKCSMTPYCSRDCQKADWKTHKKICGRQERLPAATPSARAGAPKQSPPKGLEKGIADPFTRLSNGTWLHDRPEKDVFGLLIDVYRLRMDDMHKFEGKADADSLYGGAADGATGFLRFLVKVESCPGLMPPWWDESKRQDCQQLGSTRSQWWDLGRTVDKTDIIEHYDDGQFPMQLRMLGEAVYGSAPGGANGATMMKALASMEQGNAGGMQATHMGFSRRP